MRRITAVLGQVICRRRCGHGNSKMLFRTGIGARLRAAVYLRAVVGNPLFKA